MHRVLLIDDDEQLGPPLGLYFERFELQLTQATTPSDGLARLRNGKFDAVVLDVMLPEMDGFEVCRMIRRDNDIPIIMLTARGEVMDRVVGLELGADDYLPKPFEPRELVARLQTVLRRFKPPRHVGAAASDETPSALEFEGLTIDTIRRSVSRLGEAVELTGTEYELLVLLAREPGRVFNRDDILNRLRGQEADLAFHIRHPFVERERRIERSEHKLPPAVYGQPREVVVGTGEIFHACAFGHGREGAVVVKTPSVVAAHDTAFQSPGMLHEDIAPVGAYVGEAMQRVGAVAQEQQRLLQKMLHERKRQRVVRQPHGLFGARYHLPGTGKHAFAARVQRLLRLVKRARQGGGAADVGFDVIHFD